MVTKRHQTSLKGERWDGRCKVYVYQAMGNAEVLLGMELHEYMNLKISPVFRTQSKNLNPITLHYSTHYLLHYCRYE